MPEIDNDMMKRLRRGEIVRDGKRLWAVCPECRSIIRINKPILGSAHLCKSE